MAVLLSKHSAGRRRGAAGIDVTYATLGLEQPAITQFSTSGRGWRLWWRLRWSGRVGRTSVA